MLELRSFTVGKSIYAIQGLSFGCLPCFCDVQTRCVASWTRVRPVVLARNEPKLTIAISHFSIQVSIMYQPIVRSTDSRTQHP